MQLKPLNQDDFTITIIKDLGMKPSRGSSNRSIRFAIFKCSDCASEFEAIVSQVKATRQTQCKSCSQKTHGLSKSNLYQWYTNMMSRCYNINSDHYLAYGGHGVTVCKEWRDSFESFAKWALENGYKKHLELDKDIGSAELGISPAIYSPSTCRFITSEENNIHRKQLMRTNSTGYKGVTIHRDKFKATINVETEFIHLGLWGSPLEAAKAYDYFIKSNSLNRALNNVLEDGEVVDYNKLSSSNKSGFRGVYKKGNKFATSCNIANNSKKYLGTFNTPEEAYTHRCTYINQYNLSTINKL